MGGRSTVLQLLRVLDKWTKILDEGGTIECIYMDFMKAFDTVPHKRLLEKVKGYGIRGDTNKWIASFLSNRRQRVCVNGEFSEWANVKSGIPQGSVLGPLLFVLYINDLPDVVQSSEIYLFADDTKIFHQINAPENKEMLQRDLTKLEEWSKKWLLRFHPEKCKVMHIGRHGEEFRYILHGTVLEEVDSEKDIGVTIDKDLKFRVHMGDKINKANSIMGIIRRTFTYLDEQTFLKLYKALVRPHLEYGNVIWSPSFKKDIKSIENVQKRATKQIPGLRDLSYQERLEKLKLPTLVYRRARGDMIEVYKILSDIYDNRVSKFLSLHSERVHEQRRGLRGHTKKLFKERSRLDVRKNFFSNRVTELWNSLPEAVVSAPSLNSFKNRLDKCWKNQSCLYDYKSDIKILKPDRTVTLSDAEDLGTMD